MTTPTQTSIPGHYAPLRVSARLHDTTVADLLAELAELPPEAHVRLALPDSDDTAPFYAVHTPGLLVLHPEVSA
ncbi:hypothetical protein [Streptacidiphilus carbonis]|uniref:hypothetical protein n=1 Tax=Streptacidiphilus carbonis TaxID=105422 RepID=UPI0005A60135|nr:hypothetical protein [Streptacidiphilus carbonis]